jgi:UMF1 family MFS transporter
MSAIPLQGSELRRAERAWCLYDWANSGFATTVTTVVLPLYFAQAASRDLAPHQATAAWGAASGLALLLAAALGPVLGAAADRWGRRKPAMLALVVTGSLCCLALGALGRAHWGAMLAIFAAGFVAFCSANVLYDSFLPFVAAPRDAHRVSARGFAMGYLGGGLLLALNLAWILWPRAFGLAGADAAARLALASVGVWWMGFSIPLFRHVPDRISTESTPRWGELARNVADRLGTTLGEVRSRPVLFRFLLAYWVYSDGTGTVTRMATIYGAELGLGRTHLMAALLMVQLLAAPASLAFGRLAGPLGARGAITLGLSGYTVIAVLGFFMSVAWHFWVLAGLVALVQGGTQALSRSFYSSLVPRGREAELFGFYSVSEKFAGVVGPWIFGAVGLLAGSSRLAALALVPMFVIGAWLLWSVPEAPRAGQDQRRVA